MVHNRINYQNGEFLADMGPIPTPEHSIDRIDYNGNYEKKNCHWATRKEQANNTSRNFKVELDGKLISLQELSAICGVPYSALRNRLKYMKWSLERTMNTPAKVNPPSKKNTK